jgi:Flp pilus assembly protein TadG
MQSILRRLIAETRGAEIAEAAAVMPLMFMMILGIFWFGQAFSMYGAITRAAQEGARAGAAPYCSTCTPPTGTRTSVTAANAVQAAMIASKLDPTKAKWPSPQPPLNLCLNQGTSATCDGSASNQVCVQTPVQLTSTVNTGAAGVCGIAVSFQYPFQFWLPFTSLNNQLIYLQASARMRMETR